MSFQLRAGVAEDLEFLWRLHRAAMGPHVERAFGAQDEQAWRERVLSRTDPTAHEIVEVTGEPVGCQWIRAHEGELELVRLYLLPEAQGKGIGTRLVSSLCERADREGLPVRLRVLQVSLARRLYERHGFAVVGEADSHFQMRRG